jgi:hypothetical protein
VIDAAGTASLTMNFGGLFWPMIPSILHPASFLEITRARPRPELVQSSPLHDKCLRKRVVRGFGGACAIFPLSTFGFWLILAL